ncbi:unnamed protein product [Polarella glacialis]|uniref:Uncharacterized protein n=1 Tax=Polarella glacialis TaxID=89957 RepID=A0A813GK71_POLGL|nr:unnamed protein product [Polarella glacialis]
MSEIMPKLFLGGLADAKKAAREGLATAFICLLPQEARDEGGVPLLLSRAGEEGERQFLFKDVADEAHGAEKMRACLPDCVDFIGSRQTEGTAVLVFCKWGQSRSATVVIAYLMLKLGYSLRRAFWHVRGIRQNAFPNVGFFKMLQVMDLELFGRLSMDESPAEYLAINLNKQVTPSSDAMKSLSRAWLRIRQLYQQKVQSQPDFSEKSDWINPGVWEVATNIFVSDEVSAGDALAVKSNKITRMLSLVLATEQQARPVWADETIQFLAVPLSDDPRRAKDSLKDWARCHSFMRSGGNAARTLVFCAPGFSRSSAVVMAYLIINKGYTLHHAFWSVRQRQHRCFPNVGLFEELKNLERKLRDGMCSMPLSQEEYLSLKKVYSPSRMFTVVGSEGGIDRQSCGPMPAPCYTYCSCGSRRRKPPETLRLYGPLGISLEKVLNFGDLCLVSGFSEVPKHRCLLVAGHPKYYEDQSRKVSFDVFRLKVLTAVPPDGIHQIRVAVRMVLLVIDPDTYRIYLADEADPQNEQCWLELRVYCSPFRDGHIDKELMLRIIEDVELAPCSQAGEKNFSSSKLRFKPKSSTPGGLDQELHDKWLEMLESPADAPVRVWHRYLWEHWLQDNQACGQQASTPSTAWNDGKFQKEIQAIMPLQEGSTFTDIQEFLQGKGSSWSRIDLRRSETRYTKHRTFRENNVTPGSLQDIERFKQGNAGILLDKSFTVSGLTLDFMSRLGRGKHGIAFRAMVKGATKEIPAWQRDSEVSVKVWQREDFTWEKEVKAMQRLPSTVPHCDRFIAAGRLHPNESHAAQLIHTVTRLTVSSKDSVQDSPLAIVTTIASGLSLGKVLSSGSGPTRALSLSESHGSGSSHSAGLLCPEGPESFPPAIPSCLSLTMSLPHSDQALWSLVRQILEFSVALENEGAYHGDMTLDNAIWDSSDCTLTMIDFGNAGLTKDDPWHRTQKIGCLHLLAAIRERLESDALVPSGPDCCLTWLQSLKEKRSDTLPGLLGSLVSELVPNRVVKGRERRRQQLPVLSLAATGHIRSCEQLQQHFHTHAPPPAPSPGSSTSSEGCEDSQEAMPEAA